MRDMSACYTYEDSDLWLLPLTVQRQARSGDTVNHVL